MRYALRRIMIGKKYELNGNEQWIIIICLWSLYRIKKLYATFFIQFYWVNLQTSLPPGLCIYDTISPRSFDSHPPSPPGHRARLQTE